LAEQDPYQSFGCESAFSKVLVKFVGAPTIIHAHAVEVIATRIDDCMILAFICVAARIFRNCRSARNLLPTANVVCAPFADFKSTGRARDGGL
jgi:hypothetical protein